MGKVERRSKTCLSIFTDGTDLVNGELPRVPPIEYHRTTRHRLIRARVGKEPLPRVPPVIKLECGYSRLLIDLVW